MARFYASIEGNRGEATRMGSPASGISAHPRGWNLGVRVHGMPDRENPDRDRFEVSITGGSSGHRQTLYDVLTVSEDEHGSRRVSFQLGEFGTVCYVNRDGSITSMPASVDA